MLAAIIITGAIIILPVLYMTTTGLRDTFTVCSDDEYYSETTYFYNEKDFYNHAESSTPEVTTTPATKRSTLASTNTQSDNEFVMGVSKSVWVEERYDENGNTIESRLLKKNEINSPNDYNDTLTTAATVVSNVGSDTTSKYRLTINLKVLHNETEEYYLVTGSASWKAELVWGWENDKAAEEDADDVIGITWGGGEKVAATFSSISGIYHDNAGNVQFTKEISNSLGGYVWLFREKSGFWGKELKDATATIYLNSMSDTGLFTNVKMTYIHTYNRIDVSGNVSIGDDLSLSLTPSIVQYSWQIQIDVFGIKY